MVDRKYRDQDTEHADHHKHAPAVGIVRPLRSLAMYTARSFSEARFSTTPSK